MIRNFDKYLGKIGTLDKVLVGIMVIGVLVAFSSLFRGITRDRQVQIEYLNSGDNGSDVTAGNIFVDVEGAVMSPGVYELSGGSRIKDALVKAGGFSETADRVYCEKTLNLAQEVKDGQKIYIPKIGNTPVPQGYSEANSGQTLVNINSATVMDLDTLWGVGPARAEDIVKNRPYESVEELVSKKVISAQVLERNRDRLSVY